jgi:hypothetical protein
MIRQVFGEHVIDSAKHDREHNKPDGAPTEQKTEKT